MKRLRWTVADVAGRTAAGSTWALIIVAVVVLATIVGPFLLIRHVGRILLGSPAPESRSDREAKLLDAHRGWLDPDYDVDAELAQLIAEEEARQRRFPADGGSVRGWLTAAGAIVGAMVCACAVFVVFALNVGGFNQ